MASFAIHRGIPLYGGVLHVVFGDTFQQCGSALPKRLSGLFTKDELSQFGAGAMTNADGEGGNVVILFTREQVKPQIVAHEAVHAALDVLANVGVGPMDDKNDEAYAYLVSWIVKVIQKVVLKNGQLTKGG